MTNTTSAPADNGRNQVASWPVVSQTAEYSLRSVLLIARQPQEFVSASDLAAFLGLPVKYLGAVLNDLAHAGVLVSSRGRRGGFRLARPASELTLAEVVAPFHPLGKPRPCVLNARPCDSDRPCAAHELWCGLTASVREFFERTTIEDLLRGRASPPAADDESRAAS